ncbi:pilus assembly PilX family protein [Roseateles toxinivorans]|uniref:PilX-like prepilin protein n=1 Tax=Roseateles toxinivorans TaxID=270368 RepID=A0A4R6QUX0_9BURK|nr:PilX N-terminal domain-containing pilus assembly protein [Roseateles toxinivorans]TDP74952.1 PilX-like prepilin protein [Roseateles toxinivorans]
MRRRHAPGRAGRQRGLAALVVVTVLFIVTSLVAAYTSRNLVFEQRTAANQYRSTQALEAAEAGVEWALAQLNSGVITANCQPSTNPAQTSFRNRYLNIDGSDGRITPRVGASGTALWPSCVSSGSGWTCDCPTDAEPNLTAPTGSDVFPAFRVRFITVAPNAGGLPTRPGVVRIESNGCTRLDNGCLNFPSQAAEGEGRATVSVLVALASALPSKPAAPLTVRGNLADTLALSVSNGDLASGGITIQASGTANPNATGRSISSVPGAPPSRSVIAGDTTLTANANPPGLGADLKTGLFTQTFNAWANSYKDQAATLVVNCGDAGCSATDIRNKALLNPGRPLWLQGHLLLDSGVEIGSASAPVLLLVTGNADAAASVTATAAAAVRGLIYLQDRLVVNSTTPGNSWTDSAGVTLQGALISEGDLGGTGSPTFAYDAAILNRLRLASGSFVRVPGGWKDFK